MCSNSTISRSSKIRFLWLDLTVQYTFTLLYNILVVWPYCPIYVLWKKFDSNIETTLYHMLFICMMLNPSWGTNRFHALHTFSEFVWKRKIHSTNWEAVGLERGPLSLVSTTEELLRRKCNGFGLESREYSRKDPSRWPRGTFYAQKLELTSPTSGGRSVGTVCSRTQATEFFYNKIWLTFSIVSHVRWFCKILPRQIMSCDESWTIIRTHGGKADSGCRGAIKEYLQITYMTQ
jgi:hypothetical protein